MSPGPDAAHDMPGPLGSPDRKHAHPIPNKLSYRHLLNVLPAQPLLEMKYARIAFRANAAKIVP